MALVILVGIGVVGSSLWYFWGPGVATHSTGATTTTGATNSSSQASTGAAIFYFSGGNAIYLGNSQKETNVTVTVTNNGTSSLHPSVMKGVVPEGTSLVSGSWSATYYDPSGAYICTAPHGVGPTGCKATLLPKVANGGRIVVNFLVTGATVGESLTLTYSYDLEPQGFNLVVEG